MNNAARAIVGRSGQQNGSASHVIHSIWYRFLCEEGTPLCYRDTSNNTLDVWKNGVAVLRRKYRLTKINPARCLRR